MTPTTNLQPETEREEIARLVVKAVNLALAGMKTPGRAELAAGLYFADEILAIIARRPTLNGWRLVPEEPTREMWAAMGDAAVRHNPQCHHDKVCEDIWTAALAASPQPSTPSPTLNGAVERVKALDPAIVERVKEEARDLEKEEARCEGQANHYRYVKDPANEAKWAARAQRLAQKADDLRALLTLTEGA